MVEAAVPNCPTRRRPPPPGQRQRDVPAPLARAVGVSSPCDHGDRREEIGDRREKADADRIEPEGLDDLRHPEADAVEPDHHQEIEQPEREHAWPRQRLPEIGIAHGLRRFRVLVKRGLERGCVVLGKPACMSWIVGEDEECGDAEEDRGDAFDDEQPMPAREAEHPRMVASGTAAMNRATMRARAGAGNQKVRQRMIPGKKPASATPSRNRVT